MDSEGVLMPLIHDHLMMPLKKLDCAMPCSCCRRYTVYNDDYECRRCDFYVHKSCAESAVSIQHPSHPGHTLHLRGRLIPYNRCNLCGEYMGELFYHCDLCNIYIDLFCAKYPPPEVIDISDAHHHKLILLKKQIISKCASCGDNGDGFLYNCHECDLAFHVGCVWHPSELQLNHSHHPLHPLKLHSNKFPAYSDQRCSLCSSYLWKGLVYHCSPCNFTLGMCCVLNPPPKSLLKLKAHGHELTLLPRLDSFTCNACGLKGERSPYVCLLCSFMIHQECLDLPRVININRHDHRVSRSSILGFVNSVCGVCRKKVDRTRGGFSCQKCRGYVVHSKCATRDDVWNGEELEGVPEETEDIEPYVMIDNNTIQHFSHKEHYLRLHVNGVLCDDNKRCKACTHPICLQSFYSCIECDFILHQSCAGFLKKKRHFLHNERLTLVTNNDSVFDCIACGRGCNGFRYEDGDSKFDVRCVSISEPFIHPSHPDHPLYYNSPQAFNYCNGCQLFSAEKRPLLSCIKDDCKFFLCFKCVTLPLVLKHRVDDHPLSLCYGEEASGKYWCDICEKETDPENWFYTSEDQRASLHTKCVMGDFSHLMPRTRSIEENTYEVVLNNSVSRPICFKCKLHCIYPIIIKKLEEDVYYCSIHSRE